MKSYILQIVILLIICSCKRSESSKIEERSKDTIQIDHKDSLEFNAEQHNQKQIVQKIDSLYASRLDMLLTCNEYVYVDNHFRMPDYGCTYDPKKNPTNKLGWADVLLILKQESRTSYQNYSDDRLLKIEDSINKLSANQLTSEFIPLIFLIEEKYLSNMENNEITMYPSVPFVKKCFMYENDKWFLIDSIRVEDEKTGNEWVQNKIVDFIKLHYYPSQ